MGRARPRARSWRAPRSGGRGAPMPRSISGRRLSGKLTWSATTLRVALGVRAFAVCKSKPLPPAGDDAARRAALRVALAPEGAQAGLAALEPPSRLHRPMREIRRLARKRLLGVERPVGIEQRLTADGDEIGLAFLEDVLRLPRLEDEADGHGLDLRLAPDALRERHLEARAARDALRGRRAGNPARGAVDHIDAADFELLRIGDAVLERPAVIDAVDR